MRQRYSKRDVHHSSRSPDGWLRKAPLRAGLTAALFMATSVTGQFVAADVEDREQARFLHDRLTGMQATDAMLNMMHDEIFIRDDPEAAARLAIDGKILKTGNYGDDIPPSGGFYKAVLKNWVSPWTNEEQDVFKPLNDYSATVIGLIRDGVNFKRVLYGNEIYVGNVASLGMSNSYSNLNNNHYEELEALSADLGDVNVLQASTQEATTGIDSAGTAGVMSTRQAARAYFIDGTNRAMFRFTVLNYLCEDLEVYKDNSLPSDRIRQDVSRSPGGDSSIFLNECSGCHTGMDGMASAFAYYDYVYPSATAQPSLTEEQRKEMGQLVYTDGVVSAKHLINPGNFRDGYVIADDHWINYWRVGRNATAIEWLPTATLSPTNPAPGSIDPNARAVGNRYTEGYGAAALGRELAETQAFAHCQVKKAFEHICLREPQQADQSAYETIVDDFITGGYDMKEAFIDVAVYCSSYLNP